MQKSILKQATPQETQAVKHDLFDAATYQEMKESAEALATVQAEGTKALSTFPPLMQDTFSALYKYNPKVRPVNELKSSHRFNHSMINKAMETEQYTKLRQYTKLDDVNSALATITIANKMQELINDELKEEAEEANRLAKQEETTQKMCDTADSLMDIAQQAGAGKKAKTMMNQATAAQKSATAAQNKLKKMQDQANKNAPGSQQKIRRAARAAQQEALNNIEESAELLEAWGTAPGQLMQLPAEERLALAQKLAEKSKLKKLAKLIGRFRRMAIHSQKTKITHGLDEVHDMELGNSIEKVVPSELVYLKHPQLKPIFMRKLTESQLLQYQLRGQEHVGRGPMVCCVDSSGSMDGDCEMWAKAVTLALLEIAQMQKRAFAVIFFGSDNDPLFKIEIQKGEQNVISKVIQIAEYYLGGGTDFEKPLTAAMELIERTEFKKADIVFVTDGSCDVSDEWQKDFMERKKQKSVRVHTVLVEMTHSNDTVDSFSDQVSTVQDLTIDEAVEIFQGV